MLFSIATKDGQDVRFFRDCDTKTYRLFIDETPGTAGSLVRCDFSEDEFATFCEHVASAAERHTPFLAIDESDLADPY
jgi:hypothetical protein